MYAPAREDDPLPVGIHTISVQFWPYNHVQYGVVNKQVQIQVLKRTPSIEWPTPPVMYVGDNLSYEIHLNAVCVFMKRSDVPDLTGVFRYTHDPYSFLNPAHHEIKCTFQPDDMDNYTLAEASVTQTVRCKPKIKWSNVPILRIGNIISEQHLCARCSDCSGNFQYDPCVGEEANAGGKRTFRVVFTPDDNTIYDTVEHKIVIDVLPKLQPQLTWDPPVVSYGNMLTAENALCCTSDQPGYFVYDGDGVPPSFKLSPPELESYIERKERGEISEEEEGKLILDSGKYVIQVNFVPAEGDTYAPASLAVNLTIERLVVELDYGPFEDIYYGDFIDKDKHLSAKITGIALDFLPPYDEASGGMSPITENSSFGTFSYNLVAGELLKAGTHDAVVTYEPNDKKNFSTAVVTVPLKVKRHEPEVVWPTMKPITYSTLLSEKQLCATVKPNTRGINETIAGELTYSWNIGHRFAKVGRHPISCTFTPEDGFNYGTTHVEREISVRRFAPKIDWEKPEEIFEGQKLTEVQLNATCDFPSLTLDDGKLEYDPKLGTKLESGEHHLLCKFVPNPAVKDNFDLRKAFAEVTIYSTNARRCKEQGSVIEPNLRYYSYYQLMYTLR